MTLELVRPRETLKVQVWKLLRECNLFGEDFQLLNAPSAVQPPVSVGELRQFVPSLEEKDVEVTNANIRDLFLLCDEFRCLSF
jgi:ABC-type lipopolysaccharide export system ATPase subunit